MSEQQKYEIAKEYVDRQLDTMREGNSAPADLSKEEYDLLVAEVAEAVLV